MPVPDRDPIRLGASIRILGGPDHPGTGRRGGDSEGWRFPIASSLLAESRKVRTSGIGPRIDCSAKAK